ncbi:GNAT family N-acetyltransferase [Streptomyces sp. MST-110588]|uniref:GNAT family N-acetyltransferase n=1 Tax=Streptomyces sp. MST-110588 TaxID=2833628 RepID=UPI001F5C7D35|nr:GNAT family N-acetyltransferase [Streptomyces sp. MST-110588]
MLRPWTPEEIAAVVGDERSEHWAEDFPADGDRVIAGFVAGHPDGPAGSGQRQILERESGLVVGSIGLFRPAREGVVEFGYGVVASRRGRGYASEAARAIVEFALDAPEVHTVRADVELGNPASIRVLEKAGLRRRVQDATTARYQITAQEFARLSAGPS